MSRNTSPSHGFWPPGCTTEDVLLPGVTPGNLHSIEYFAAAMAGLIGVFIIQNFARHTPLRKVRLLAAPSRAVRGIALHKVPGFSSFGLATVVVIYVAVNLILCFTMLDWPVPLLSDFARRLGWVTVGNIAFLFFLALKNTPLAFLTEYSYDRLNELHQIAGWTTIGLAVLHTIVFIVARSQEKILCNIVDPPQHPGMVATGAMLVIGISVLLLKSWKYEAFYVIHVIMSAAIIVTVSLHRPDFSTYSVRAMIFTAGIFALDRIIRGVRLIVNRRHQRAVVAPLPGGGTMVTLTRPVARAVPGKFALLMIRKAGFLQSHPFTIVSINPVKFVFDSHRGFTARLHRMALGEPDLTLKATVDGPYGTTPKFGNYDKVILIAGGTGASFTFAVATELLRTLDPNHNTTIEFVWTVREIAKIDWFREELRTIQSSPLVKLSVHTTDDEHASGDPNRTVEKQVGAIDSDTIPPRSGEKPNLQRTAPLALRKGRPITTSIISSVVSSAGTHERVVVGACGPEGLMRDVRNAVAAHVSVSGPSIDLHIESFGW